MQTPDSVMEPGPRPAGPGTPQFVEAREQAIRLLTDRYGDGTLGDAEFELRLGQLRAAADAAALEAVAVDLRDRPLPETGARHAAVPPPRPPAPPRAAPHVAPHAAPHPASPDSVLPPDERRIVAMLTETRRSGWWAVPRRLQVRAILSEVKLDLREASIAPDATIEVMCIMANVTILVPPGLAVEFEVSAMLGNAIGPKESPALYSSAPRLRVVGSATLGEVRVKVVHPTPPGQPKRSPWRWLTGE